MSCVLNCWWGVPGFAPVCYGRHISVLHSTSVGSEAQAVSALVALVDPELGAVSVITDVGLRTWISPLWDFRLGSASASVATDAGVYSVCCFRFGSVLGLALAGLVLTSVLNSALVASSVCLCV